MEKQDSEAIEKWVYKFISNFASHQQHKKMADAVLKDRIEEYKNRTDKKYPYDDLCSGPDVAIEVTTKEVKYHQDSLTFKSDMGELEIVVKRYTPEKAKFHASGLIKISADVKGRRFMELPYGDSPEDYVADMEEEDVVERSLTNYEIPIEMRFSLEGDILAENYIPKISEIGISADLMSLFSEILFPNEDPEFDD